MELDTVMTQSLKSPYPYFGGKSRAAPLIWAALGDCPNVVDPFFGSGAVLLGRPHEPRLETVNDLDGHIPNFWRAMQYDPEGLAQLCDVPVCEVTQHAYHTWLVEPDRREAFTAQLMGDPDYYDLVRAARWCAGLCMWIGHGWCSGDGPWQSVDGMLTRVEAREGTGVSKRLVHLGDAGRGVPRKGISKRRVHLGGGGPGVGVHSNAAKDDGILTWFTALQARLRHVRVCCGDWTRVLGPSVTWGHGLTGILLDPPYAEEEDRDMSIYAHDSGTVAHDVRAWCVENGKHPLLRIVLCGYETTHDELLAHGWTKQGWAAHGGYGNQGQGRGRENAQREMLWLSPNCIRENASQLTLF